MEKRKRRPLVMGNWKMNLGPKDGVDLAGALLERLPSSPAADVAVAPPFLSIGPVCRKLAGSQVIIPGAQNMHWEDHGAFTGEIAPSMLVEAGVRMVIIGHSERRNLFEETDEMAGLKVAAAFRNRIVPVLCVGELEQERDADRTLEVTGSQVRAGLQGSGPPSPDGLVLAYEPVWAIGTGRTPTLPEIEEVHRFLREELRLIAGIETAARTRILYGGSMNQDNSADILSLPNVDGGLVGGASLDAGKFAAIVESAPA